MPRLYGPDKPNGWQRWELPVHLPDGHVRGGMLVECEAAEIDEAHVVADHRLADAKDTAQAVASIPDSGDEVLVGEPSLLDSARLENIA